MDEPFGLCLQESAVTDVIDKAGIVRHVFSSILSADRHVAEALEVVRALVRDS